MNKSKTTAQRSAKLADKRKTAGHVKVSTSAWVLKSQKDDAKAAMRKAAEKFKQPNPEHDTSESKNNGH